MAQPQDKANGPLDAANIESADIPEVEEEELGSEEEYGKIVCAIRTFADLCERPAHELEHGDADSQTAAMRRVHRMLGATLDVFEWYDEFADWDRLWVEDDGADDGDDLTPKTPAALYDLLLDLHDALKAVPPDKPLDARTAAKHAGTFLLARQAAIAMLEAQNEPIQPPPVPPPPWAKLPPPPSAEPEDEPEEEEEQETDGGEPPANKENGNRALPTLVAEVRQLPFQTQYSSPAPADQLEPPPEPVEVDGEDDERAQFRRSLEARFAASPERWPDEHEKLIDWMVNQRFEYLVPEDLFAGIRAATERLRATDSRLRQFAARLLVAGGVPLRRGRTRRYGFDGLVWRTDDLTAILAAWLPEAYELLDWQTTRPVWMLHETVWDEKQAMNVPKGPPTPVSGTQVNTERIGPENRGTITILRYTTGGYTPDPNRHEGYYELAGQTLPQALLDLLKSWLLVPEEALTAIFAMLPQEEDLTMEDPVQHLSTPNGLLTLRPDGGIDRHLRGNTARQLGITRLTVPLPDLDQVGDVADLDWREYAPVYAAALERALPDAAVRDYFWRAVGYSLSGLADQKLAILLYGPFDTGKTTAIVPVADALGTYGGLLDARRLLTPGAARDNLCDLRGQRLAVSTLHYFTGTPHLGRFDQLTGNTGMPDGWLPQAVLWLETRAMPHFSDILLLARRLRVIPFSCPLADDEIKKGTLTYIRQNELPGVLLFAIQGWKQYLAYGLDDTPLAIKSATVEALVAADVVNGFARLLKPSDQPVPFSVVYSWFEEVCARIGQRAPGKNVLSEALRSQGITLREPHARKLMVYAKLGAGSGRALLEAGHGAKPSDLVSQ